jgi:ABC-type branched-subunit amino acid transport system substrate-binding protein/transcriptional regulator with XRE-family HTH domain
MTVKLCRNNTLLERQERKIFVKPNLQLKQERELRGWSQARVAQEIGTSAKIVSRWERGTSLPSPYFRERLCQLFGKDAMTLALLQQEEHNSNQECEEEPEEMQPLHPSSTLVPAEEPLPVSPVGTLHPSDPATTRKQRWGPGLVRVSIFPAAILLALFFLLFSVLHPFGLVAIHSIDTIGQQEAALQRELASEKELFKQKGIGMSEGSFAFDIYAGRLDVTWKEQAALALQQHQTSRAINLLTKATTIDPTDGEAQIYNENLHVLQKASSYVTIVLGLSIGDDSANLSIAREDLQAAFLAQEEINSQGFLPGGLQLRIQIDNSGVNNDDVAQVAQFIKARVDAGNPDHMIAVVGWPFSSQTIDARDIIAAAHIPLISQSSSSIQLSGSSPYFFRVNPPDEEQGSTLGSVAVKNFHAHTILVLRDPSDPYSVSLADAFSRRVAALNAVAINDPRDYFSETITTVDAYQVAVQDTLSRSADLIFLAGLDVDAIRLAHAVGDAARANPGNPTLAKLKILGGDALDTDLLLGQGSGADAQLVQQFPQDMQRLCFTAFAHADEWTFLHIPQRQQPAFFQDWAQVYQSSPIAADNAPPPAFDVLLTYDAVRIVSHVAHLVHGALTGQAVRNALVSLGKGKLPAYQGISGRILFNSMGDPVDKAIVVLTVEEKGGRNTITLSQVLGTFR